MNATHHSTSPQPTKAPAEATSAPVMHPVERILDLVADAGRMDDPWYWRDRWVD